MPAYKVSGSVPTFAGFEFEETSTPSDTSTLLQVSRPPSFNSSSTPCPVSSVLEAFGLSDVTPTFAGYEFHQRSMHGNTTPQVSRPSSFNSSSTLCPPSSLLTALCSDTPPKFAGYEFEQMSTHDNAYTAPQVSRPPSFNSSSTPCAGSPNLTAFGPAPKFAGYEFEQMSMHGNASTTPQVSSPCLFNSSSTAPPGSSFMPTFRASGTLTLGFGSNSASVGNYSPTFGVQGSNQSLPTSQSVFCASGTLSLVFGGTPALSPSNLTVKPEENPCACAKRHCPAPSSDFGGSGTLSLTFGPTCRAPPFGSTPTYLASDSAVGASGPLPSNFVSTPALNQSNSSPVVSSFGITPSISKEQSGGAAKSSWAFENLLGASISEMHVDRSKRRREDNIFIDEEQSPWNFRTRKSPFGRQPLCSTTESYRKTPEAMYDILWRMLSSKPTQHEGNLFSSSLTPSLHSTDTLVGSGQTIAAHPAETSAAPSFGRATSRSTTDTQAEPSTNRESSDAAVDVKPIIPSENATDMQEEASTNTESSDAAVDVNSM